MYTGYVRHRCQENFFGGGSIWDWLWNMDRIVPEKDETMFSFCFVVDCCATQLVGP